MAHSKSPQESYTVPGRERVMPVTASITLLQMMRPSVTGKGGPPVSRACGVGTRLSRRMSPIVLTGFGFHIA
jgi:hypothetical protein